MGIEFPDVSMLDEAKDKNDSFLEKASAIDAVICKLEPEESQLKKRKIDDTNIGITTLPTSVVEEVDNKMEVDRIPISFKWTAKNITSSTFVDVEDDERIRAPTFGRGFEETEKILMQALMGLAAEGVQEMGCIESTICFASCLIGEPNFNIAKSQLKCEENNLTPIETITKIAQEAEIELNTISHEKILEGCHEPIMILLDNYVGFVEEDPLMGEEEKEIGSHVMLIAGGDLETKCFVTYDPFCVHVTFWTYDDLQSFNISHVWTIRKKE